MIIAEAYADIAYIGAGYVAHGVNCIGKMGAGVAKDLAAQNPGLADRHREMCECNALTPGQSWIWRNGPLNIINMATQQDVGSGKMARIEWVEECVSRVEARMTPIIGATPIYIPKIASGLGGLDWNDVRPVFDRSKLKFILCHRYAVIIAGGRDITDESALSRAIADSGFMNRATTIISGTQTGVDTMGEAWALAHNMPLKREKPDWSNGKRGGPERNRRMAMMADALIAVWDGKSAGTGNMISQARSRGLDVHIHIVDAEDQS